MIGMKPLVKQGKSIRVSRALAISGLGELSKVVRVRYEKGVLRLLEKLDLEEGEELVVFVRKHRVGKVLDNYVGMFGEADVEELKRYEEEAQAQ